MFYISVCSDLRGLFSLSVPTWLLLSNMVEVESNDRILDLIEYCVIYR